MFFVLAYESLLHTNFRSNILYTCTAVIKISHIVGYFCESNISVRTVSLYITCMAVLRHI